MHISHYRPLKAHNSYKFVSSAVNQQVYFGGKDEIDLTVHISDAKQLWEAAYSPNPEIHPKISVLIPFYNVAPYLEEAIRSLQEQTFTNWEAILLNDGSTDKSLDIAKNLTETDPRFLVIDGPHIGIAATLRNWMATKARGEYISFLDSDDLYAENDVLERQLKVLEENPDLFFVNTPAQRIDQNGNSILSQKHDRALIKGPDDQWQVNPEAQTSWVSLLNGTTINHVQGSMLRTNHWVDMPEIPFHEDHVWHVRLAAQYGIDGMRLLPFHGFKWRENPDSITQDKNNRVNVITGLADRNEAMFRIKQLPNEYKDSKRVSNLACARYRRYLERARFEYKSAYLSFIVIRTASRDPYVRKRDITTLIVAPVLKMKNASYKAT